MKALNNLIGTWYQKVILGLFIVMILAVAITGIAERSIGKKIGDDEGYRRGVAVTKAYYEKVLQDLKNYYASLPQVTAHTDSYTTSHVTTSHISAGEVSTTITQKELTTNNEKLTVEEMTPLPPSSSGVETEKFVARFDTLGTKGKISFKNGISFDSETMKFKDYVLDLQVQTDEIHSNTAYQIATTNTNTTKETIHKRNWFEIGATAIISGWLGWEAHDKLGR